MKKKRNENKIPNTMMGEGGFTRTSQSTISVFFSLAQSNKDQ